MCDILEELTIEINNNEEVSENTNEISINVLGDVSFIWKIKDEDTRIITNIDRFTIGDSLEKEMNGRPAEKFFTAHVQHSMATHKRIVYVIDEAQSPMFFHRKY